MTHDYTTFAGRHRIDVSGWRSSTGIHFEIQIDGDQYTTGSSENINHWDVAKECKYEGDMTAKALNNGSIRCISGEWRIIEDEEFDRGAELWTALCWDPRDEWQDGGAMENATEGTTWDFAGWGPVRTHMVFHGWFVLGGDAYVRRCA